MTHILRHVWPEALPQFPDCRYSSPASETVHWGRTWYAGFLMELSGPPGSLLYGWMGLKVLSCLGGDGERLKRGLEPTGTQPQAGPR